MKAASARGVRSPAKGGTRPEESAAGTRSGSWAPALAQDELIGLPVAVVASGDAGLVGLRGTVVDETQRTFVVQTERGAKTVPKHGQRFQFTRPDGRTENVEGSALAYRPEERIKKSAATGRRTRSTR